MEDVRKIYTRGAIGSKGKSGATKGRQDGGKEEQSTRGFANEIERSGQNHLGTGSTRPTAFDQNFASHPASTVAEIRRRTVEGAERRIRPALMTSGTTILALLPVLSSAGRGADIMVPMAIPSFGGMAVALVTVFVVPILYCSAKEWQRKFQIGGGE